MAFKQDLQRIPPRWNNVQWDDFRIGSSAFQFAGAADPELSTWQPGGAGQSFLVYAFKTNDIVYFVIQMPHDWVQGSNLRAHVHWTPRNRGVAESGKTVIWTLAYSWANINAVFPASSSITFTDTCTGVDHAHLLVTGSAEIDGSDKTMSSMLICALSKSGGTWVGNAALTAPVLLEFDLHYQKNSLGSDGEYVKTVG